ncbi:MAG: hypothetical protein QGG53_07315, partial [Planctomycetota bacterium]|nr:hypothetical protein [Planctomycetota bacterium]
MVNNRVWFGQKTEPNSLRECLAFGFETKAVNQYADHDLLSLTKQCSHAGWKIFAGPVFVTWRAVESIMD